MVCCWLVCCVGRWFWFGFDWFSLVGWFVSECCDMWLLGFRFAFGYVFVGLVFVGVFGGAVDCTLWGDMFGFIGCFKMCVLGFGLYCILVIWAVVMFACWGSLVGFGVCGFGILLW